MGNSVPEILKMNDPHLLLDSNAQLVKELVSEHDKESRIVFAKSFCYEVLYSYWNFSTGGESHKWDVPPLKGISKLDKESKSIADVVGVSLSSLPVMEAGYFAGMLYTTLLPADVRAKLGAYYTPPALVNRLISNVTAQKFDWSKSSVLDPACGGAAFLCPVALKKAEELDADKNPVAFLEHLSTHLRGFEIDEFAAWISRIILEVSLFNICRKAGRRLPDLIISKDAFTIPIEKDRKFDLVIGNPPYGKVKLNKKLRKEFSRSLYGHANLYGLFTDLAIRWGKDNGYIAYVTPTSFLGGQYFKKLRKLLKEQAPPVVVDFIAQRKGVFPDVLQETLLIVYRCRAKAKRVRINMLTPQADGRKIKIDKVGSYKLSSRDEEPWLFPRTKEDKSLLGKALSMETRLADYGYCINTGQLVWNRHKAQLRSTYTKKLVPIVWAESIDEQSQFNFCYNRINHKPFLKPLPKQDYLFTEKECILLKRTTSKEQKRRLVAAKLPMSFINKYGKVIIENHLNIIRPINEKPDISVDAIIMLLNSETTDKIFRCISGSVAVSAYELNALPLPTMREMKKLERKIYQNNSRQSIEEYIKEIYHR